ncbi:MAG: substrate-binding domain-containing protein [Granulosicoccus sp.]|nr:substrate-binding domain-containing protein [Granulosicoccus sp.]
MSTKSDFNSTSFVCSLAIVVAGLMPVTAMSDDVILKAADGSINITGELVEFADDNYVIRTTLGEMRISASRVSCEGEACPEFETAVADVVFAGSNTVGLGMMPLLLTGYASHLDAESSVAALAGEGEILAKFVSDGGYGEEIGSYLVTPSVTGDAFTALLNKSAQIGMASRRIQPEEARELRADGAGNMISPLQEHVLAVDSLVVIVHPENELGTITIDQLRQIYSGELSNWSDLGGEDIPIKVLDRNIDAGTRGVFMSALFGDAADEVDQIGAVMDNNNDMAAMVYDDPAAIGYAGYAFQRGAKPLALVNECGIQSSPDAFSAKTEEYPLQRRLYLYNRSDNLADASADFIDYATSSNADGVIAKSGFIDLGVKIQNMDMEGSRAKQLLEPTADAYESNIMREMLRQMLDFDRLSTTFRFATGAFRMDERSVVDMARLANYLESQPEGTTVMFAGFTDSVGAFDSNRDLSARRAAFAAEEFGAFASEQIAQIEVQSAGFGEIAPVACNTDDLGRSINRRVEVWIKPPL